MSWSFSSSPSSTVVSEYWGTCGPDSVDEATDLPRACSVLRSLCNTAAPRTTSMTDILSCSDSRRRVSKHSWQRYPRADIATAPIARVYKMYV